MPINTRDLLDFVLVQQPSDTELGDVLREVVGHKTREDQWLDFEHGSQLSKPKPQRAADLQKKIAGFANADGGLLVIGVEEHSARSRLASRAKGFRSIPPPPSTAGWAAWAHRTLDGVFAQAARLPVVRELSVSERRKVLVVGTAAADRTVWVRDGGELVAFVRVGEHTAPMPRWMHADLVLGRRRHPDLKLELVRRDCSQNEVGIHVNMLLRIVNTSLVWVRDFHVGLVAELERGSSRSPSSDGVKSHWWYSLQSTRDIDHYLDTSAVCSIETVRGSDPWVISLLKTNAESKTIPPLGSIEFGIRVQLPSPVWNSGRQCMTAMMALYVVPETSFPQWWRLLARIRPQTISGVVMDKHDPTIERMRPLERTPIGNVWGPPTQP